MSSSRVASRQRQQHNMDEEDKHETPRRRRHTSPFRRRQREFGLNESYEQEEDQPTPRTNATATERESPRTKRFHAPNDTSLLVAAVDEEEAHAVFAAAMAASGMNFGATEAAAATDDATPVRRNNAQQKVKAAHTPEEQWRSAEEDWQMASGGSRKSTKMHVNSRSPALSSGGGNSRGVMSVSPQRSPAVVANAPTPIDSIVNEQHMENDDDDDDNDSLFDDLGSLGDRSVKSAASGVSRPFLVQRADPDSSDDEEAVLRKQPPLVPKSNPNRPRYPGRKKSSASSVRHSDSESTVAISNTRQRGKPPFERQVVAMMVPEKQVQSPPVSSNNNNNLFQPIASSSPVPVATSARKAVQKPSPQKVSAESAVSPSSRVRMVQEAPPPQASSSPAVDNSWANFDSAFQEDAKVEAGASATPSKQSPSSSGGKKAQEYESLGVAEMTSSQSHGNSTDEQEKILTEMLAKQNISRGEISSDPSLPISQSKSSQFHSESTNGHDEDEDEDDETISVAESMSVYSVSTLGTERTDFSYAPRNSGCTGAARKLSAVPEDNALQCNNKDNPVEWMWSYVEGGINAMNAAFVDATTETKDGASTVDGSDNGASRATSATVGAEEERVQGYNPDGPTDQTFSSLQPISTASDDPDNSFQAWIGYAADLLFPPIANCSNENNFSEGQMEVTEDQAAGLVELAQSAARAAHEKEGLEFNEHEVDVCSEVKFSVIRVALPLGILFQENEAGCWVARIFTSGNAARAAGDDVQVGDQLASIDGKSAIRKTTEEISIMISGGGVKKDVELTFLRYTGPLRTASETAGTPAPQDEVSGRHLPRTPSPQKSMTMDVSPNAGQEVVVASAREIKKNSSREDGASTKTFDDQNPAPLLVRETSKKKSRNPIKRLFSRKKKQFTA